MRIKQLYFSMNSYHGDETSLEQFRLASPVAIVGPCLESPFAQRTTDLKRNEAGCSYTAVFRTCQNKQGSNRWLGRVLKEWGVVVILVCG